MDPKVLRGPSSRKDPAATRRRVALAAADLFATEGYAATYLQTIADAAGVHVQTIYLAFGTKVAVLGAALAVAVAGDDDAEVPPAEWPWVRALLADPDPSSQLRRYAAHRRREAPRAGPLVAQARDAARADPAVAALLAGALADEHGGIRALTERFAARGALRQGLDAATAAATLLAIATYEGYERLVGDRRWTAARYERWLAETLIVVLLADGTGGRAERADPV